MIRRIWRLGALPGLAVVVLLFANACAPGGATEAPRPGPLPRFEPARCPVPAPAGVECGYLAVAENRARPDSRAIRLGVAILKSRSDQPAPDPVVFLTGGPGASALEPLKAWRDHPFRETRDVILIEQRGTEHAEPWLDCPEVEDVLVENMAVALSAEEEIAREVEAAATCRDRLLAQGADLSAYNSAASAADLEDLRRVLGIEQWNLYGVSYGTRLALTVARDFPAGVRSLALNSPFPIEVDTYVDTAPNAYSAFHALFADCEADADCRAAFPNLEADFYHGLEQVNAHPISVSVHVSPGEVQLTAKDLIAGMFSSLRGAKTNALLPFIISGIYAEDPDVLVPMVEGGLPSFSGLSRGMLHSVECYEEAPFNPPEAIQAAAGVQPILLDYLPIHFNLAICDIWPSGQAGPVEDEPLHSDIPTLFLVGEYDPYTPPAWSERAAETLPNSYLYIFPGIGHGPVSYAKCARSILLEFVEEPTTAPDASCLVEMRDPDFVTPDEMYLTPAIYRFNVDLDVAPNLLRIGLLGLCLLAFLVEVVAFGISRIRARRRPSSPTNPFDRLAIAVAGLNLAFFALLLWAIAAVSATNWLMLGFGLPAGWRWLFWLPRLAALLTLGLPLAGLALWRRRAGSTAWRRRFGLLTLAAVAFVGLLLHWQMLNLQF